MNVLVVEPGMAPYEKEVNGLKEMQATVGAKGNTPITLKVDPRPATPPEQPKRPPKTPGR